MSRLLRVLLAISLCFAVPSCSLIGKGLRKLPWKKKKKDTEKKDDAMKIIGVVELVNPDQHFVLIRTQGKLLLNPGLVIYAMDGAGGQSKLKVSPEKKQDFLIADIVDGSPRMGNVVLFKPDKSAVPPPADPNQPVVGPGPPPNQPPPPDLPVQPPPISPVNANEFTRPGMNPAAPAQPSPIPQQPVPGAPGSDTIPVPGQVQLPPVIR